MSSSDDDLEKTDDSSKPDENVPQKTLRGLGLKVPRPPGLSRERSPKRPTLEDFAEEATQIVDELADEVIEDIDGLLEPLGDDGASSPSSEPLRMDEDSDEFFAEEKTQVAAHEFEFPEDETDPDAARSPEPPSSEPGSARDMPTLELADMKPLPPLADAEGTGDGTGDGTGEPPTFSGLEEDSLPEPIRQRIPTLEPSAQSLRQPGLVPPSGRPPEGEASDSPAAFRGDPSDSDDDFHAGATEVLDSPFESDPAVAKLVALDGPAVGMEVFVSGLRNTVGRGTNNSVVVADLAMSRQHFEIVKNPDESFSVRDLQSINGTTLNGTKVREGDLFHGDRLEAGKSLFQFVVTGEAPTTNRQRRIVPAATATMGGEQAPAQVVAKSNASTGSINRMIMWASIAAVLASLVIIAALVLMKLQEREEPPTTESGPTAATIYLEGVEAVKAKQWDEAERSFEKARTLDPTLEGIDDQLRRIEMERQARTDLATARRLLEQGMFQPATEKVEAIPRDSRYFTDAKELLREARKVEIERFYTEAQRALTEEDIDASREAIDAILARVRNHQGALRLRERIDAIESGEQTFAEAAEATRELAKNHTKNPSDRAERESAESEDWGIELVGLDEDVSRKKSKKKGSATPSTRRGRVPNFTEGFLLYRSRKFSEATAFFESAADEPGPAADRAERIATAIEKFESDYREATAAFDAGNWASAETKLVAARRADSIVGDYFAGELKTKLATVRANLGLQRLANDDPVGARRYYSDARDLNANDSATAKLGERLEKEASSLYVTAVNQRKTDPARAAKICRTIMRIVPESHEAHEKASRLLESM